MRSRLRHAWRAVREWEWAPLALIVGLYFAYELINLRYPGLHIDEAANGIVSHYVLWRAPENIPQNHYYMPILNEWLMWRGRIIPVMSAPYLGSVMAYWLFPFLCLLGPGVTALRLPMVLLSSATLVFLHGACRSWFGRRVAIIATALTAADLSFAQFGRLALQREEIVMIFFLWAALYFLTRYRESGGYRFLCGAALFLGLGISMKIIFLWYLAGAAAALSLPGVRRALVPDLGIKKLIAAAGSFCAGAVFLIVYNVKQSWATARLLVSSLLVPNSSWELVSGVNNLDYPHNLAVRLLQVFDMLGGRIERCIFWGVRDPLSSGFPSRAMSCLFLIFMAGGIALRLLRRKEPRTGVAEPACLFLVILYSAVLLLSPFTVSGFDPGHMFMLLPFPQIAAAWFLASLLNGAGSRGAPRFVIGALLLISCLVFNAAANVDFSRKMRADGGSGRWSTSIGELTDYLVRKRIERPVMFGIALQEDILFLSGFKINSRVLEDRSGPDADMEISEDALSAKAVDGLYSAAAAAGPGPIYCIWAGSEGESVSVRDYFFRRAARDGRALIQEKIFVNRAGRPVYWLYRLDSSRSAQRRSRIAAMGRSEPSPRAASVRAEPRGAPGSGPSIPARRTRSSSRSLPS